MNPIDRNYTYIAKTFDAPTLDTRAFAATMSTNVLPGWRRLHEAGLLASVQVLHKIGDVNLQTSAEPVRDWEYFALLELHPDANIDAVLEADRQHTADTTQLARYGVQYLSNEVLVRPAALGTAIPTPSPHWPQRPPRQSAAVEYIQIPDAHWDEYRRFMQEVMGPVGTCLVAQGHSYQIQILECIRVLHHDASLPAWNRIHILWGEFDDAREGFLKHTTAAVRAVLGPDYDVHSALDATGHYRVKPRMSQNHRLEALCIEAEPSTQTQV